MKISWSVYNKILPNYKKPFSLVANFFILNLKQKWKWIEKISGKRKKKKSGCNWANVWTTYQTHAIICML